MNKQFCANCGSRNQENAGVCPNCGTNLEERDQYSILNPPIPAAAPSSGGNELFSSITDDSAGSGGSSSSGTVIIGICCVLSIFFGGLISLAVAGLVYLPFRNREGGWIFFVIPYILTSVFLLFLFSR